MLVMWTSLVQLAKNENYAHHDIDEFGMAFANVMIHHRGFIRSPHREPTVSSQLPLIARASHSPPGIETFFPLVLKHFSHGIKRIQACGWFSNSYCPFQHSTFPTLICLQQSSLSRFKKDNFYIVDLHWLFESDHDLE